MLPWKCWKNTWNLCKLKIFISVLSWAFYQIAKWWLKVLWACAFLDRFFSFTLLLQNRLSLKIYWFEITCIMKHKYQFCQDYNVSDILWHLIPINVLIPVIRVGKWHLFPAQSNLYLVFSKKQKVFEMLFFKMVKNTLWKLNFECIALEKCVVANVTNVLLLLSKLHYFF